MPGSSLLNLRHLIVSLFVLCSVFHSGVDATREDNIKRRCRVDLPSCFPEQLKWTELEQGLTGTLVFPDKEDDYTNFNFQWNHRTKTYPLVHVMVKNAEDIRAAILFARKYNLHVTIKSSGADFLGRSSAHSSFSINLMTMNKMNVNNNTTPRSEHGEIMVESGATWKEIYTEVNKYKRVIVGPGAHMVSAGGYTMGGGHSILSPSLGLAVDNVLEIQVVLADGRIATCTENRTVHQYPDGREEIEDKGELFWALRGGGGGTFGVVVYYVFKLHPAPESLVRVIIGLPFYHNTTQSVTADVITAYNSWTKRVSSSWGAFFLINNYPMEGGQTGVSSFVLLKLGPWDENTKSDLQEFYSLRDNLPQGFLTPFFISNISNFMEFFMILNDGFDPRNARSYTMGSLVPAENHNASLVEFFRTEYLNDEDVPLSCTFIRLGGKVKEFGVDSASVHAGWRSAESCISCFVGVAPGSDTSLKAFQDQARLKASASGFAARLRNFGDGEYINEADTDNPDWKMDFWGIHHGKLLRIKIRNDPDNFFSCHHCVGSTYTSFIVQDNSATTSGPVLSTFVISILTWVLLFNSWLA